MGTTEASLLCGTRAEPRRCSSDAAGGDVLTEGKGMEVLT